MAEIFAGEIEGLVAQSYPVEKAAGGGWRLRLNDLYATTPRALGLVLHVEDVRELGKVLLAEVRVEADVITEAGIEHRTTVMPILANLDGEDRIEPVVEQTFIQFQVAKAREEAMRHADRGEFDQAVAEEMEDLEEESRRLRDRLYEAKDRKYHAARAMAARDLKADYAQRVSRRRS